MVACVFSSSAVISGVAAGRWIDDATAAGGVACVGPTANQVAATPPPATSAFNALTVVFVITSAAS